MAEDNERSIDDIFLFDGTLAELNEATGNEYEIPVSGGKIPLSVEAEVECLYRLGYRNTLLNDPHKLSVYTDFKDVNYLLKEKIIEQGGEGLIHYKKGSYTQSLRGKLILSGEKRHFIYARGILVKRK